MAKVEEFPVAIEPAVRLLTFSKTDTSSLLLWPQLLERAVNFVTAYEADTDPNWLFASLNEAFFQAKHDWLVLAEVEKDKGIIAHLIAQEQPYGRLGNVVFVLQLEQSEPNAEAQFIGWQAVLDWACKKNIRYVMNFARNPIIARLYRQKYGFEDRRVIQSFDLLKRR